MQIRNPLTGQYDYRLDVDDAATVAARTERLRAAQPAWSAAGVAHRVAVLSRWAEALEARREAIVARLATDTGRRRIPAVEFAGILGALRGWVHRAPALLEVPDERPSRTAPTVRIRQQWVPYPVVGVISPWNFPLLLALLDTLPALAAGCAVALKPSEVTPRFLDPLEDSIRAVPELAGVLYLARGGADTGRAIVDRADAICFTGSVPTGRQIAAACAARLVPAFLELGGKDPAIVLADADLEVATDALLRSCAGAAGQACQAVERVYVHESIFADFVDRITRKARAVRLADAAGVGDLGPLIFDRQAAKIRAQLNDARARGATVHCGGDIREVNGALFCPVTVLTDVTDEMDVVREETFGPVIPVQSFAEEAEAVARANAGIYGLSAAVFGRNADRAAAVASQLEVGAVSINDGSLTNAVYDAEKNSFKQSGLGGSRMGDAGFLRFFRKRALLHQTAHPQTIQEIGN